ncbi:MAG: monofunctional biosynthetic peptidoglycan transglycosylase [Bacteroidales bacterium]|jgi:monofunctional biosynthetic peptidoglycan transglycosylase|nr:monofunctional biosynthetic peptidoglycan transglycosylase [Bacteroidales bacterium]
MKKFLTGIWRLLKYFILIFIASTLFFVVLYRFVNPPVTPLMVIRLAEQAYNGQTIKLRKDWVSLDKIAPAMPLAAVASEDNRFFEHRGFDLDAIEKAREYNEKKQGKKIHGASTISQQTAKNVFLWPQRSWIRKGLEVYFTVLIEFVWGKKRIMEIYLNVIETGKGIYGVEAASQAYFGKPASKLSRGEAALIAAILPNPLKWNPTIPTSYLSGRQQWILWNMGNIGRIDY